MKKILVPCDFSDLAISAFRTALNFAVTERAEVHLVNVIELPVLHDSVLMPTLSFEQALFKELEDKTIVEFAKIIPKYNTDGVKVVAQTLFGQTWRMIIDYATREKITLIVMGTHGASGLKEFFIGSTTEKVVRNASCPVMAIRKFIPADKIKKIVFPNTLDTEHQEDLVMHVKALQNYFQAKLHIIWINTPANFTADSITRKRLEAFASRYMIRDYHIDIVNDPVEETGILQYASSIHADLIVMGTRGRKGIAHFLNGSLAEDVVNHMELPIWTYKIVD